jgi:hypothetical protein
MNELIKDMQSKGLVSSGELTMGGKILYSLTKVHQVDKRLILRYVEIYDHVSGSGVIRNFPKWLLNTREYKLEVN